MKSKHYALIIIVMFFGLSTSTLAENKKITETDNEEIVANCDPKKSTTSASYKNQTSLEIGKLVEYPDFKICLNNIKNVTFEIGGVERMQTVYQFDVIPHDSQLKPYQATWSWGYPGGIGPLYIKAGRRLAYQSEVTIKDSSVLLKFEVLNNLPEYNKPIELGLGDTKSFKDFDLKLLGFHSSKFNLTTEEQQEEIENWKNQYLKQTGAAPKKEIIDDRQNDLAKSNLETTTIVFMINSEGISNHNIICYHTNGHYSGSGCGPFIANGKRFEAIVYEANPYSSSVRIQINKPGFF